MKITLDHIAEYIKRDHLTWKQVSLLYIRMHDSKPLSAEFKQRWNSKAMLFEGRHNDCLILGADAVPHDIAAQAACCIWIEDIAQQWNQACFMLQAITAQESDQHATGDVIVRSILIVEDEMVTSQMMAHYLQQFADVTTTSNSREAAANYMVHRPDLVLLDIHYDNDMADGFDVLRNLRSVDGNASVVMVSGEDTLAAKIQAFSLGARGFIAKPFRPSDFSHHLERKQQNQ